MVLLAASLLLMAVWMPSTAVALAADEGLTTVDDQLLLSDEDVDEPLVSSGGLRGLQSCIASYSKKQCKKTSHCCSHNCVNGQCRKGGDLNGIGQRCRYDNDCHSHYCSNGKCKERGHHGDHHDDHNDHDNHHDDRCKKDHDCKRGFYCWKKHHDHKYGKCRRH
ncbi:unnamed protein product [Vitrella brassicaformis CCMP3155]|uniref:Dickkopf N-terminal cysteine-rich domain-containing protein n=1 Tax=Vitrella brassicaformis (strain CCMP3155) TaxID=1169540 RepID=A0A0G4H0Q2_VITBC|nr:unnamed protein product [Vitrella brassicaformis CCMP3155]|eukprot:CEM37134.1 unnamed protein product [Vitrella brassicaformis CCMP3155]